VARQCPPLSIEARCCGSDEHDQVARALFARPYPTGPDPDCLDCRGAGSVPDGPEDGRSCGCVPVDLTVLSAVEPPF